MTTPSPVTPPAGGFFELEPFAARERTLFRELKAIGYAPHTVLDIGAAVGSWSAIAHAIFPGARYELFEPLADRQATYGPALQETLSRHPNFRLHTVALSNADGEASFWIETSGFGSSLLTTHTPQDTIVRVPTRRLDAYAAERGIAQPQIIKADVQGAELMVLQGGLRTFAGADLLVLETHLVRGYGPDNPLLTELIAALEPLGFRLVRFGDVWRAATRAIASVDAFFMHDRLIARLDEHAGGAARPHKTPAVRVHEALAAAAARGRRRAALYGAGHHTRWLGPALASMPLPIAAIIDDNPRLHGTRVGETEIIPRHEALPRGIDVVVLSSDAYEPTLWEASADLRHAGVEVLPLYETFAGV